MVGYPPKALIYDWFILEIVTIYAYSNVILMNKSKNKYSNPFMQKVFLPKLFSIWFSKMLLFNFESWRWHRGLRYGCRGNNWLNSNALQNQECYDNKWNCFLMDFTCIDSEYWLVRCRMRTSSSEQRKLENWIIYVCLLESAMHVSKFNICNM